MEGATSIINEMSEDELEAAITKGWFLLGKRVDGAIVVIDDLNTFVSATPQRIGFWKQPSNRVFDEIAMTTQLQFEKSFIGKVDNTITGLKYFPGSV